MGTLDKVKGLVENLVGYSRNNFLVPVPRVDSMDTLNAQLLERCLQYRDTHKVQGRSHSVKDLYSVDKACLHSIAPYRYDTARMATPTVGDYATIRFDRNEYSVPVRFLRKPVTVKGYANKVVIICDHDTVVTLSQSRDTPTKWSLLVTTVLLLHMNGSQVRERRPINWNIT